MAQVRRALAGMFRIVCATLCVCGCHALARNVICLEPVHGGPGANELGLTCGVVEIISAKND